MNGKFVLLLSSGLLSALLLAGCASTPTAPTARICPLKLDGLFFETAAGRTLLPAIPFCKVPDGAGLEANTNLPDGRTVTIAVKPDGNDFALRFSAAPDNDILKWGLAVAAAPDEYFTGLMERVVDGPQQNSWATNLTAALNLRGQAVDNMIKPTLSLYAPFYLSSRGYAVFVKGT